MTDENILNPVYDITSKQKVGILPTRGEKRLMSTNIGEIDFQAIPEAISAGLTNPSVFEYEALSYARKTLTDYVTIRLPNRFEGTDNPTFVYRFLINPKSVSVSHQTSDAHSMTRSGWQFGVWGEDTIDINITGVTCGQYVQTGLTDRWDEYSISYRNLMELVNLFENNGYYFEGESSTPSVFDANYTRKRIKMHQDVEMRVGNFIWKGMFTNMTVEDTADTPFLIKFSLGFLAWKEE